MTLAIGGPLPHNPDLRVYPNASRPDRMRWVDAGGLRIATYEWGNPDNPPLLLAHGGFDFAGTMDVFAPILANAGWRVVSWDHRGHGSSEHAALYSLTADTRDALHVLISTSNQALPVIGHSKGGALTMYLAAAAPHLVSHVVNIDGLPSGRRMPDVSDHERTRMLAAEVDGWLQRRSVAHQKERLPGTIEELASRRARMNPRLDQKWLEYLVPIGATKGPDGWRWNIDPVLRFGGFGPWRPSWAMELMRMLHQPTLGIIPLIAEEMGWGTQPEDLCEYLPAHGRLEVIPDAGHFAHIEQPQQIADLVLEFLG